MISNRKVRKDFDATKEYSVSVAGCTEEEKKEVQQAFFDSGFPWKAGGKAYQHLDAEQYANTTENGDVTEYCMYGSTTKGCNMTSKEFLDLLYEPKQKGHVHAELMAQYAEDAKTHYEPWKLWEYNCGNGIWCDCSHHPYWGSSTEFRRKPKTHTVNGVEIPELRVSPKYGEYYYLANPVSSTYYTVHKFIKDDTLDIIWVERGLAYQHTEEGSQAAILHAKAMLGII